VGGQEDLLVEKLLFFGAVVILFVVVLGIDVFRALVCCGFDGSHSFASFYDRDIIVRARHAAPPSCTSGKSAFVPAGIKKQAPFYGFLL